MSQQEDDLRALAKIMDFLRAVSILMVVIHFDRTAGLFRSILYTKLFALVLLALSCLGTKGVKEEKITWARIWTVLAAGLVLFFLNWWILSLPLPVEANAALYTATAAAGYVCLLMSGTWMSRLLRTNLMEDVFNVENERVERRVHQRGKPVPCFHRAGHAGQRQVVCRGKQFHQAAD